VRARLRIAKLEWRRAAYKGDASALVLLACSSRLATALPDSTVELIAQQFSSLYLGTDVRTDVRYLDSVGLAIPGGSLEELYEFKAGVDYFSAHGDRRWWHDHRIPGGIAFSINSPGHLVRSGWLAGIAALSDEASGVPTELATVRRVVNSPEGALELAMRTIFTASNAVSGKATTLVPRDHTSPAAPACARDLPRDLSQADCSKYLAYYDTDWTLRTEFFRADVERPAGIEAREMDLTYFYDRSAANTDADLIEGVQVRHGAHVRPLRQRAATLEPRTVRLRDHPELAGLTE
jgi:hypothetical protein